MRLFATACEQRRKASWTMARPKPCWPSPAQQESAIVCVFLSSQAAFVAGPQSFEVETAPLPRRPMDGFWSSKHGRCLLHAVPAGMQRGNSPFIILWNQTLNTGQHWIGWLRPRLCGINISLVRICVLMYKSPRSVDTGRFPRYRATYPQSYSTMFTWVELHYLCCLLNPAPILVPPSLQSRRCRSCCNASAARPWPTMMGA